MRAAVTLLVGITVAACTPDHPTMTAPDAIRTGNIEQLKRFAYWCRKEGCNLNGVDDSGKSLVLLAASSGNAEILDVLIDAGADINFKGKSSNGFTSNNYGPPLVDAARAGDAKAVKALLDAGAVLNARDEYGGSAVNAAVCDLSPHLEALKVLVAAGAEVNIPSRSCSGLTNGTPTPLNHARWSSIADRGVHAPNFKETIDLLVAHGGRSDYPEDRPDMRLSAAVMKGDWEQVKTLILAGVDANTAGQYGQTPLTRAAGNRDTTETIEFLLKHGADVNKPTVSGETPLHHAVIMGDLTNVKLLASNGANINAADNDGTTPIERAQPGSPIYEFLKSSGATADIVQPFFQNPAHAEYEKTLAAALDRPEVAPWIKEFTATGAGVVGPGRIAKLDGESYEYYEVCRPHNCMSDMLYMLFTPGGSKVWVLTQNNRTEFRYYGEFTDAQQAYVAKRCVATSQRTPPAYSAAFRSTVAAELAAVSRNASATSVSAGSRDRQSADLANRYWASWSLPNAKALGSIGELYGARVNFYGKEQARQAVMDEKTKFAERWPDRKYAVRDASTTVSCEGDACVVKGIVDWTAASVARSAEAKGAANFSFTVSFYDGSPRIAAESGSSAK